MNIEIKPTYPVPNMPMYIFTDSLNEVEVYITKLPYGETNWKEVRNTGRYRVLPQYNVDGYVGKPVYVYTPSTYGYINFVVNEKVLPNNRKLSYDGAQEKVTQYTYVNGETQSVFVAKKAQIKYNINSNNNNNNNNNIEFTYTYYETIDKDGDPYIITTSFAEHGDKTPKYSDCKGIAYFPANMFYYNTKSKNIYLTGYQYCGSIQTYKDIHSKSIMMHYKDAAKNFESLPTAWPGFELGSFYNNTEFIINKFGSNVEANNQDSFYVHNLLNIHYQKYYNMSIYTYSTKYNYRKEIINLENVFINNIINTLYDLDYHYYDNRHFVKILSDDGDGYWLQYSNNLIFTNDKSILGDNGFSYNDIRDGYVEMTTGRLFNYPYVKEDIIYASVDNLSFFTYIFNYFYYNVRDIIVIPLRLFIYETFINIKIPKNLNNSNVYYYDLTQGI